MLEVNFLAEFVRPPLEARHVDRLHRLRVDARAHGMRVLPTFLFVDDDGARLAF